MYFSVSLAMQGPRPVVLSGPSGAGKSTLLKKLLKDYENIFGFSVSREYPYVSGEGQWRSSGLLAQSLLL